MIKWSDHLYDLPATAQYSNDREEQHKREERAKRAMENYQEARRRAAKTAERVRKGKL